MNELEADERIINKRLKQVIVAINFKILIAKVMILILILFIVFRFIYGFVRMKDNSMEPFISEGQLILYSRINDGYKIGDVVVFEHEDKNYVLRIVAKEGQMVEITDEGEILVDGFPEANQSSLYPANIPSDTKIVFPYKVKEDSYFVVGDYSIDANDSRNFGAISENEIKGKVISLLKIRNI